MYGGADIGTGTPITRTRGFGAVGVAVAPWPHITIELIVNRNPGILHLR
jgi:hypothetical protein